MEDKMGNADLTTEQKLMIGFLVKVAIPLKYYDNKKSNRIKDAIWRAHRDVLTGRRLGGSVFENYVEKTKDGFDNDNSPLKKLYDCITDCKSRNCSLTSECLFEILAADFFPNDYGALQKLINMSLKYFIILNEFEDVECNDIPKVNYKYCDCPLDRKIIEKLSKKSRENIDITLDDNNKRVCWTSIKKDKYDKIQQAIPQYIDHNDSPFGNLTFDFENW